MTIKIFVKIYYLYIILLFCFNESNARNTYFGGNLRRNENEYFKDTPKSIFNKGNKYFNKRKFNQAIKYFKIANELLSESTLKQNILYHLGLSYYSMGNYKESKKYLEASILLNYSDVITKNAEFRLILFGLDTIYNKWVLIEAKNINYNFQDTFGINVKQYVESMENAFNTINSFFRAKLPKKIDYFIWSDKKAFGYHLRQKDSFTMLPYCVSHGEIDDDLGHELTHSLSYFAVYPKVENILIYEGMAIYFGLSERDYFASLERTKNKNYSIVSIWKNPQNENRANLYALGSEIVKMLIEWKGRRPFMKFMKDQSYDNAKRIYGKKLDNKIIELEENINNGKKVF